MNLIWWSIILDHSFNDGFIAVGIKHSAVRGLAITTSPARLLTPKKPRNIISDGGCNCDSMTGNGLLPDSSASRILAASDG